MKKLFLCFQLLFFTFTLIAQTTEELFTLPGYAIVMDRSDDMGILYSGSIFLLQDTIHEGETYYKYLIEGRAYVYLQFEGAKVIMKEDNLNNFSRVLCDFDVNEGEIIQIYTYGSFKTVRGENVESIVYMDGYTRKKIDLISDQTSAHVATWIEGIGYERFGFLEPLPFTTVELKCVSSDFGLAALYNDFTEEECSQRSCRKLNPLFTIVEESKNENVIIQPNNLTYDSMSFTFGDGVYFDEHIYEYTYEEQGCYLIESYYYDDCGNEYSRSKYYNNCQEDLYQQVSTIAIREIQFYDEKNGVGVLEDRPFYTLDGGLTWTAGNIPQLVNDPGFIQLKMNGEMGLMRAYGNYLDDPRVLFTEDGGRNWEGVKDDGFYTKTAIASNGYLFVGGFQGVEVSKDKGGSWNSLNFQSYNSDNQFLTISNDDTVYVINRRGKNYQVLASNNYGESWTKLYESDERIWSVYFIDENNGLLGMDDHIVRTSDQGNTWTRVANSGEGSRFNRFSFSDDMNGVNICARRIYRTTDSGYTWFVEDCDNVQVVGDYQQVDGDNIFVIKHNNLYKRNEDPTYECGETSDVVDIESQIKIYPNPVSKVLNVEYAQYSILNYAIFDIRGIAVLDGHLKENQYIDVGILKSGLYFVQFQTENGESFHKLVVE